MSPTWVALLVSFFVALFPVVATWGVRWWLGRRYGIAAVSRQEPALSMRPGHAAIAVVAGAVGGALAGWQFTPWLEGYFWPLQSGLGRSLLRDALAGPLAEELGKGAILAAFFAAGRIRSTIDGMMLGIAAGAGFAALESFVHYVFAYASGGVDAMTAAMQVRAPLGLLVHGSATGLMGAWLGTAMLDPRRWLRASTPVAAVCIAVLVHGLWNGLLVWSNEEGAPAVALLALCVPAVSVAAMTYLARRDLHRLGMRSRQMRPFKMPRKKR